MENKHNIRPSYDTNRQILGNVLPIDTPFNVIIDASEACQFRCNYCFRSDNDKTKWGYAKSCKLMEWGIFYEIINQIKMFPQEVKQISLSCHGEPLCNRNLPNMVRYIKSAGLKSRVSIHTNAALLDQQYAEELMASKIDRVVVSLQGLSPKKYKKICGVDINFEEFYHILKMMYWYKINTQIYIKIADTALDENEDELFYEKFSPIADRVFIERIVPIWKDVNIGKKEENIINKFGMQLKKQECCPLIFHTIVIDPEGEVYPCTQLLTPFKLGNIMRNNLVELWNSDLRKNLLIRQCECKNPEICRECYIAQNSIYTEEDMIDKYKEEILKRLIIRGEK